LLVAATMRVDLDVPHRPPDGTAGVEKRELGLHGHLHLADLIEKMVPRLPPRQDNSGNRPVKRPFVAEGWSEFSRIARNSSTNWC
jgi:hypothetical protein